MSGYLRLSSSDSDFAELRLRYQTPTSLFWDLNSIFIGSHLLQFFLLLHFLLVVTLFSCHGTGSEHNTRRFYGIVYLFVQTRAAFTIDGLRNLPFNFEFWVYNVSEQSHCAFFVIHIFVISCVLSFEAIQYIWTCSRSFLRGFRVLGI